MDENLKTIIWDQFGASIDMLENAITDCDDNLWIADNKYWYTAYHTLFFLDYYLSDDPDHFNPPTPFTLSEMDPAGVLPERVYTREELLIYLRFCRKKCHDLIQELSQENAGRRFINSYRNYSITEILLYNMRHVQHHTAQLILLLRQESDRGSKWVSQSGIKLGDL